MGQMMGYSNIFSTVFLPGKGQMMRYNNHFSTKFLVDMGQMMEVQHIFTLSIQWDKKNSLESKNIQAKCASRSLEGQELHRVGGALVDDVGLDSIFKQ